jgi:hypothetical protein
MTPQQLKAMKLALEALELINIEFVCSNGSHHKKEDRHEWDEDCPITNRWRKAITALKERLAYPMREVQRLGQEIEQEPDRTGMVYYKNDACKAKDSYADDCICWTKAQPPQRTEPVIDKSAAKRIATALGWTPPRTWVGLTDDDEIDWEEGGNLRDLFKAIEAKLKEKNT